ncbi:hypothetical protein IP88_06945 [alpha proteobacterium AAP81b]|nr:hypothetical protein IP88_06945 [alpha proteobacterium AAP81b]
MSDERRPPRPLDPASLRELALGYAARFATSRTRLTRYLARKLRERGWHDADAPADVAGVVARLAELGYVDDDGFAAIKARGLTARGFGARRVEAALRDAGIDSAIIDDVTASGDPLAAAIAFARRRRLGPFAATRDADPRRALAAMARAGHGHTIAMQVLRAASPEALEAFDEDN